ncbi:MAG: FtsQ-type POTRA domain-containing protein, partial [Candidatus Omnitrophota bacterium]
MAKKKKIRRSVRGKGLAGLGGLLTGFLRMTARVFPWLLAAFAVAALFLAVRSALMADTSFGIQQVTVTPPQDISTAKRQALETRYLGKNILRIDLAKAAEDLEQDPEIEWAHVRRDFPSTLSIHIRRRVPMALIRFSPRGEYGLVS